MKKLLQLVVTGYSACFMLVAMAGLSEISVDLKMDELDYVSGEQVRAIVDVKNLSPDTLVSGIDMLLVEVFSASDHIQLERKDKRPITANFIIRPNEGQKFEVFLSSRYGLRKCRRYLARAVMVHAGQRYEGQLRAFDVVSGVPVENSRAMQMFSNHGNMTREFELVHTARKGCEHLFLSARDDGDTGSPWVSYDVGPMMKITKPTISILTNGTVLVIHRTNPDTFVRSEFWSLPEELYFHTRVRVDDPETAGQKRVQELYKESGGVKPVDRPWWKFW